MLLQKLVYCPVAPSESRVWALQEDSQILVEFGSGCWRMESTSPWEELPIVPRDSLKSTVFKFVWFYLYNHNYDNKLLLRLQISGLQSFFSPTQPKSIHFFQRVLNFSIIRILKIFNRWNYFLKIISSLFVFKMVIFPIPQEFRENDC